MSAAESASSKYLASISEYALKHNLPNALAAHYSYCSVVEDDMGADKFTWKKNVVNCPTCGLSLKRKAAFTMKLIEYPQKSILVGACTACGQRFFCGPLGVAKAKETIAFNAGPEDLSSISTLNGTIAGVIVQSDSTRSFSSFTTNKPSSKKRKPASALARMAALEDVPVDNSLSSFLTSFQM